MKKSIFTPVAIKQLKRKRILKEIMQGLADLGGGGGLGNGWLATHLHLCYRRWCAYGSYSQPPPLP